MLVGVEEMSYQDIAILLMVIIGFGIVVGFISYGIPAIPGTFDKALDDQRVQQDKIWSCIDDCDSGRWKPSHESCVRMCT